MTGFIRKRIAEKGWKEFYALEILEAVIPNASYTYVVAMQGYLFTWNSFSVEAQSKIFLNVCQK